MTAISFNARKLPDPAAASTQCAILPVFKSERLSRTAAAIDKACGGAIKTAKALDDFSGKRGEHLWLQGNGNMRRLLLLGCGEKKKFDREAARKFCDRLVTALSKSKATDALLHLPELGLKAGDAHWLLEYLARRLTCAGYRYERTLSKPAEVMKLKRLIVDTGGDIPASAANATLNRGKSVGIGTNLARDLANLPGNICNPSYLAKEARKLGRGEKNVSVSVLDEGKMKELGMGALLSVSAGSEQPARLIVVNYRGGKASDKPHVLVGKGITFDTGGISLKPGAKMDEMKYDMGGAASVLGTLKATAELALPLNVIGVVAAAENMPSGAATRPGDVVTSMSGKTIEILNTDAEGRLVLCDALTYVARFKPETVIDIATLTGACIVALGSHASGLFANDDQLAEQLLSAGTETHDRAWRLPLWEDYQDQLKSNFADIANIGGPGAGTITAACFLARFTRDYRWAHLDIAGSAWDSSPKGATGRPVALLTRYLMDQCGKAA